MDSTVNITYYEWRVLSLATRKTKIDYWKRKGIDIPTLASIWGVSSSSIYKLCSHDNKIINNTVPSEIAQLLKDPQGQQLIEIITSLLSMKEKASKYDDTKALLDKILVENERLQSECNQARKDLALILNIKEDYTKEARLA